MLFDAHAHVYDTKDKEGLIRAIEDSDLKYVMDVGCDIPTSEEAVSDAAKYPWCYAAIGFQPGEIGDAKDSDLDRIRELAADPKVCAIGEIGLDYHYDHVPRDVQERWFRMQIRLANELKMPIMIHTREADDDTMRILKEEGAFSEERKSWFPKRQGPSDWPTKPAKSVSSAGANGGQADAECQSGACSQTLYPDARVMLHCYSGSAEMARQYVKLGATISICGPVTFKNNRRTTEVVQAIPLEFLLAETDSPYLAPEPMRGRTNMPPYVEHTVRRIAVIKGVSFDEAAEATCANAERFFGIR